MDFALLSYIGVMSVTPGPNNLLLAASGVHFGFRRTVPHLLGISFGVFVQFFVMNLAFAVTVGLFRGIRPWLAVVGCAYLLHLSWKIFRAGAPEEKEGRKPMRFHEAALFQAVNPKAWIMVVNTALLFTPRNLDPWTGALVLAAVSATVNLPCVTLWAMTGDRLRRFLASGRAALVFNAAMGALMAGTAVWLLIEELVPH
jgi:threonine/homoserine/homoserine lactone efflux protein